MVRVATGALQSAQPVDTSLELQHRPLLLFNTGMKVVTLGKVQSLGFGLVLAEFLPVWQTTLETLFVL
jgi:hypothetical protein